jgi:integrase
MMAGVRKKKLSNGKFQGWYMGYHHGNRKRIYITGTQDRIITLKMMRRLEDEHHQIALGHRDPPKAWDAHQNRDYAEVVAEYLKYGESKGGRKGGAWGKDHARMCRAQLTKFWPKHLRLKCLGDMQGILPKVEAVLIEEKKTHAGRTVNGYAEPLSAFYQWCSVRKYVPPENPLAALKSFNGEPVTIRRAPTQDEFQRIWKVAPNYWKVLLPVACCSGIRASELRSLSVHSIDAVQSALKLKSVHTKNRKKGLQQMPEWLLTWARDFALSGEPARLYAKHYARLDATKVEIPAQPLLYVPTHPTREFDKLLLLAGVPKETEDGVLVFHSLRNAFATFAGENGASFKQVQELMRHSSPQMTSRYMRTRDEKQAKVVDAIGDTVISPEMRAKYVHSVVSGAVEKSAIPFKNKDLHLQNDHGGGGNRTRRLLHPLILLTPLQTLNYARLHFDSHQTPAFSLHFRLLA